MFFLLRFWTWVSHIVFGYVADDSGFIICGVTRCLYPCIFARCKRNLSRQYKICDWLHRNIHVCNWLWPYTWVKREWCLCKVFMNLCSYREHLTCVYAHLKVHRMLFKDMNVLSIMVPIFVIHDVAVLTFAFIYFDRLFVLCHGPAYWIEPIKLIINNVSNTLKSKFVHQQFTTN
jgi:hypothetical protein